jgi:plastocyanin
MWSRFFGVPGGSIVRVGLAMLVAVMVAGACQTATPSAPVPTSQVDLPRSYRFAPEDIVVPVGTTVTWTNNDNFSHTVRLLDSDDVQLMRPGESVTHTFAAPGLYRYDCSLHPKDMQGSVLVEIAPA